MRALCPGSDSRGLRCAMSGSAEFSGPAVIGLSALFGAAVGEGGEAAAPGNGGGGGAATAGSSGEAVAGNGGATMAGSGGSGKGGSESSGGSEGGRGGEGLDYHWQQDAVALTTCHLWRINCRKLYCDLRAEQPAVLLSLLRRLLQSLGVAAGGSSLEQAAPRPREQHVGGSKRVAFVQRLLSQLAELEAAAAEDAAEGGGKQASRRASRVAASLSASWHTDSRISQSDSLRTGDDDELECVGVGGGEDGGLTADVLHGGL